MRVTVIEDNQSLAKGIAYRLRDAGHAVDVLHDGLEAEAFLKTDDSDVVILDVNLPGLDGITLLRGLRARDDGRPVILLTARSETADRVLGLDAGADDYLVKPFEMSELEARLRALARRPATARRRSETIGGLTFDYEKRQVSTRAGPIKLPRRELALLECLIGARDRVVPKSVLLDQIYGAGADVEESVVEVYVSRLRRRLGGHGVTIRAERGLGYQLTETGA